MYNNNHSSYPSSLPQQLLILYDAKFLIIPVKLIMDGKVITKNLEEHNLSMDWLEGEVKKHNTKWDNVFYAVLSSNGSLYFDIYNDQIPSRVDKE
ncbi:YetF domain-containing protein [Sutcliffiella horikoshii]|uniref:YetF domain-containing protein n=1 Tax=Sutcliffiella horikoshii TaxID=79883 RepID=UPI00384CA50C